MTVQDLHLLGRVGGAPLDGFSAGQGKLEFLAKLSLGLGLGHKRPQRKEIKIKRLRNGLQQFVGNIILYGALVSREVYLRDSGHSTVRWPSG
nr:hypothetical protein Itr_chr02CG02870 [Ipomoea trifida]GMC62331.1 hypothetical protein Iba_chr02cCG2880 [Ipomoea batatas]GME21632.1 hypothetical protein Iba_scaffold28649CG0010 [Ipomoea batatas]